MSDDRIKSAAGGERQKIGALWEHIPGQFSSLVEVARISHYGAQKYALENWKSLDPRSEQSPLNHAIGHCFEAAEMPMGDPKRIWALGKAAWNCLAQIWMDKQHAGTLHQPEEL